MTWPTDKAACYGLTCPHHADCARYIACEGNSHEQQQFIDTCRTTHDDGPVWPLFELVEAQS